MALEQDGHKSRIGLRGWLVFSPRGLFWGPCAIPPVFFQNTSENALLINSKSKANITPHDVPLGSGRWRKCGAELG